MAAIKDNKHKCSNHRRAALAKRRAGAAARAGAHARLATLEAHVKRLCDCLGEAAGFAEAVSPGTGHNAGLWATAITEARAMLSAQPSASNGEPVGDPYREFGRDPLHPNAYLTQTRGEIQTLYRTDKGVYLVHVITWSDWQGDALPTETLYRLTDETPLQPGGRFEGLGRAVGLAQPLTFNQ